MKKRFIIAIAALTFLFAIMFGEYRFIMNQQRPYLGERGTVYIEVFGRVDTEFTRLAGGSV